MTHAVSPSAVPPPQPPLWRLQAEQLQNEVAELRRDMDAARDAHWAQVEALKREQSSAAHERYASKAKLAEDRASALEMDNEKLRSEISAGLCRTLSGACAAAATPAIPPLPPIA